MELKLFAMLDNKAFLRDARFFLDEKRRELVDRFYAWATNCVARVYEHGDIKWASKAAAAAEICGFGPTFRRCYVPNIPFAYNKEAKSFEGSIQAGKRAALSQLNENGVLRFEADIRARLDSEGKPKENKTPDYIKRLERAVAAAITHGVAASDIKKAVSETLSKSVVTVSSRKAA